MDRETLQSCDRRASVSVAGFDSSGTPEVMLPFSALILYPRDRFRFQKEVTPVAKVHLIE